MFNKRTKSVVLIFTQMLGLPAMSQADCGLQGYKGKTRLFVRGMAATSPAVVADGQYYIGQITVVALGL